MQQWARMPSRVQQRARTALERWSGFDRRTLLKQSGFVLTKQTVLWQSNNEQGWPWTVLKPSVFTCGFQNGLAGFKMVRLALKPTDSFEAGRVSNRSITNISWIEPRREPLNRDDLDISTTTLELSSEHTQPEPTAVGWKELVYKGTDFSRVVRTLIKATTQESKSQDHLYSEALFWVRLKICSWVMNSS